MKTQSLKQNARNRSIKFLLVLLILIGTTVSAYAATVRGKLVRRDAYGRDYAAAYVKVTLSNAQVGQSAPAYTGSDGMYYFYNVPPGYYTLEIWVYPGKGPLVSKIHVLDYPYTDISPLLIP